MPRGIGFQPMIQTNQRDGITSAPTGLNPLALGCGATQGSRGKTTICPARAASQNVLNFAPFGSARFGTWGGRPGGLLGERRAGGTPAPHRGTSLHSPRTPGFSFSPHDPSGFRVLIAGNRLKSRSTVQSSPTPPTRQEAAIRASWINAPRTLPLTASSANLSRTPGESHRIRKLGDSRHAPI